MVISVPQHPLFHPKDCEPILLRAAPDLCITYAYWDWDDEEWVLTNTAMLIKGGKTTLFLRMAHVTECPGGPEDTDSKHPKRRLSDAMAHTPSPVRVRHNRLVFILFYLSM